MRRLLHAFGGKARFIDLLADCPGTGVRVLIGAENPVEELREEPGRPTYTYRRGGPRRMLYSDDPIDRRPASSRLRRASDRALPPPEGARRPAVCYNYSFAMNEQRDFLDGLAQGDRPRARGGAPARPRGWSREAEATATATRLLSSTTTAARHPRSEEHVRFAGESARAPARADTPSARRKPRGRILPPPSPPGSTSSSASASRARARGCDGLPRWGDVRS
jgi:hypothetical protein